MLFLGARTRALEIGSGERMSGLVIIKSAAIRVDRGPRDPWLRLKTSRSARLRVMLGALFLARVLLLPPGLAEPVEPAPASQEDREMEVGRNPRRLQEQIRVIVQTNTTPTMSSGADASPSRTFQWNLKWKGWDGLHIGIAQRTPLEDPLGDIRGRMQWGTNQLFHLEEVKMSGKIGAKLALDGAAYTANDDLAGFDAGVEVRRARIYAKGDCLLILPVSYQIELGYIPDEFYIEESYLAFRDVGVLGDLKIGQFQAPMGLEVVTSSRDLAFMEPAAPLQALAPGVNAGFQMGEAVFRQRATWAFGLFTDGVGQDFGDASRDYGRAILRFTGLPIDQRAPEAAGSDRFLHLGLSANLMYSGTSAVRYRSRPESHLAPYVIDTGNLDSQGALVVGVESAWVNGPFWVQGEFLHSFVENSESSTLGFHGFYGSAGWFLTGESRPYNRLEGCFARVVPRTNFNWGEGGWGALELAGRYSFVDLVDGPVDGGRLGMFMAGLNWYPHAHVKWRLEYGFGRVTDRQPDGNFNVFQMRAEVDF